MNVFDLLKKDHRKVEDLFKKIEKAEDNTKEKTALFKELKNELAIHMEFEEKNLYTAIKECDKTHDLTMESFEEHHVAKFLIKEIEQLSADKDEWIAKVTVLQENIEHHVEEEEGELFPKAKKVLSKEKIEALTLKYEQVKDSHYIRK